MSQFAQLNWEATAWREEEEEEVQGVRGRERDSGCGGLLVVRWDYKGGTGWDEKSP